jgi:cytochrome c-type biogenesis protein
MISDVSLVAAFAAGLLSMTSPCVLPLIPLYLAHFADVGFGKGGAVGRSRVMFNALAFVLGFSILFVLLGASIGAAGGLVADGHVWLVRGGALLVLMGRIWSAGCGSPSSIANTASWSRSAAIKSGDPPHRWPSAPSLGRS